MHEYEVGTETKNGLQRHRFNASRHRIVDGALVLQKDIEDSTERAIVVIFAADKWTYVIDCTLTRQTTDATQ
jgi:hypothetical protein